MKNVGFVGWRGMVGSVLMDRMVQEKDFDLFQSHFFTTSQVGQDTPNICSNRNEKLADARSIDELKKMDIIVTCQGGDYTKEVHGKLRSEGWNGYWIDAASSLRMSKDSIIILDPINMNLIEDGLSRGVKDYIGGNCTVSLMLMSLAGLVKNNAIDWISSMTYQAASGAGARHMKELIAQMGHLHKIGSDYLNPSAAILELDKIITDGLNGSELPTENFGFPLAGSLLPWIDVEVEEGRSREEWKGMVETNKLLGLDNTLAVDGTCVRMGAMRCHSQAFTIKLKSDIPLNEIESMLDEAHQWVSLIPNKKEETLKKLTPAAVTGTLDIPIGRVRKMHMGKDFLNAFTVGDQLLWGAAEPLRRLLRIILD